MAIPVDFIILLLNVEFAEEVESDHRVDVHDDGQQHHRQDKLWILYSLYYTEE